jgi:hypothetical protein
MTLSELLTLIASIFAPRLVDQIAAGVFGGIGWLLTGIILAIFLVPSCLAAGVSRRAPKRSGKHVALTALAVVLAIPPALLALLAVIYAALMIVAVAQLAGAIALSCVPWVAVIGAGWVLRKLWDHTSRDAEGRKIDFPPYAYTRA